MTFLVSLFVTSQKCIVWCFFDKENYCNLTKSSCKFQASVTERCTSLSKRSDMFRQNLLKVPVKKLNFQKTLITNELLQKCFRKFLVGIFSTIYLKY